MSRQCWILITSLIVFSSPVVVAGELAPSFTLDGLIKDSSTSSALLDPHTLLTIQILDPSKTCLLYEESQYVDTTATAGYFNIQVGSVVGSSKRTSNDPGRSLAEVYQNSSSISANNVLATNNTAAQTCTGGSYTPTSGDARYFRMIVKPQSTGVADALLPETTLDSVPMANVAETLQGLVPTQLLQVGTGDLTQSNLQSVFASGNAAKLNTLIAGGGNYLSSSGGSLSGGLSIVSGGLNNGSGGITNAGSITGIGTSLTGTGSVALSSGGTNQSLSLSSSGTGAINMSTGSGTGLSLLDPGATSANHVTVKGAAAGASPTIGTAGTDANVNLSFTPKGTGSTLFTSGNVGIGSSSPVAALDVSGLANFSGVISDPATTTIGVRSLLNASVSSTNSSQIQGFGTETYGVVSSSSASMSNALIGMSSFAAAQSANVGTISQISAFRGAYGSFSSGGGTVTNAYGLLLQPKGQGGAITNMYGVYVNTPTTGGTISNEYGVYVNSSSAKNFFAGQVGVGTNAPAATMEVAGEVKVGSTSLACSTTTKGSLRYNTSNSMLEFCNGSTWGSIAAQCSGTTPSSFSFSNVANQSTSTLILSNKVQVTGINCQVNTSISGSGSPAYRICADSGCATVVQDWTAGASSVVNGQYIQLELTTPATGGLTYSATMLAGGAAAVWSVATTGDCSGLPSMPPPVGTVCSDGSVYAGTTPDGNAPMFAQPCDYGQTWNGVTCTGSAFLVAWDTYGGTYTSTGQTNSISGKANTAALASYSQPTYTDAPYAAAAACAAVSTSGITYGTGSWYLPSKSELMLLSNNASAIGHFSASTYYWASTEGGSNVAFAMNVSSGVSNSFSGKSGVNFLRCVRH